MRFLPIGTHGRWSVLVPGHLPYEVGNAILRARSRGRLTTEVATRALASFSRLIPLFSLLEGVNIVEAGAHLAMSLGVNFYDACYLQVARLEGVRLLTADASFYRQTNRQADVLGLGDYSQIR
ncbi:MAG: type II toxin-antitoxin system VapC family toxin [Dehalococcoidia bacterium]